jgi:signal peptidase I
MKRAIGLILNMKRTIGFILIVVACAIGFLSIRGTLPFMPISGSSMLPQLKAGDLITVAEVNPSDIKVGDIIVFNIPPLVQDAYNYPTVVAHRVIRIVEGAGTTVSFRTKGDNTGEDPFTVRPQDLRGIVSHQFSGLGFPLLFFQSQQGLIFVIIALALLAFFLYGGEIARGGSLVHRGIFAPIINEEKRANLALMCKIEATEDKMNKTEEALDKFAAAVAEYAQHLASHTSAIQGLSEASHELKKGAAEQNRVLMSLVENMGRIESPKELKAIKIETPAAEADTEKPAKTPRDELEKGVPGCARKRPLTPEEILSKPHP